MKTLIFKSINKNISGFIEYRHLNGAIEFSYNIKSASPPEGFLKLYAASSKKPFTKPIIADTLEFSSQCATNTKSLLASYLLENGYRDADIDTFVIAKTDNIANACSIEATCFALYEWDVTKAFNNDSIPEAETPIKRGEKVLEGIKNRTKTNDPKTQKLWIDKLFKAVSKMKKSDICPIDGYTWYISESMRPPIPLSAYRHLLFVTEVMTEFDRLGFYLFGVKDEIHTALAIKSEHRNPFVNANDCYVRKGNFFIVGVYLGTDGVYFEKPEI